jgi:hypothetical protein
VGEVQVEENALNERGAVIKARILISPDHALRGAGRALEREDLVDARQELGPGETGRLRRASGGL